MLNSRYSWALYALVYVTMVCIYILRSPDEKFARPQPFQEREEEKRPLPPDQCNKIVQGWPPERDMFLKTIVRPDVNTTLLMPKFSDGANKTNTVIICTSSLDSLERRNSIRETWMTMTNDFPASVIFLVGKPDPEDPNFELQQEQIKRESEKYGDILQEDFIDTYNNLTVKSMFLMKFASTFLSKNFNTSWVLKVDDDCYVDVSVLLKYQRMLRGQKLFLVGKVLGEGNPVARPGCFAGQDNKWTNKWEVPEYIYKEDKFPNALSGSGYLMNMKAVDCLFEKGLKTKFLNLEDVFITGLVASQCPELSLKNSPRFQYMGLHVCHLKRKFDMIVHYVKKARDMKALHSVVTGKAACLYNQTIKQYVLTSLTKTKKHKEKVIT